MPRRLGDVARMAVAAQANLAQLRTTDAKRAGIAVERHAIQTPLPGPVRDYRETLIDWKTIKAYSNDELALRLREVWGQFSVFCWAVHAADPHNPPDFANPEDGTYVRSACELAEKAHDLERSLWRLQFEQRVRHDPAFRNAPEFAGAHEAAMELPLKVYGEDVQLCSDANLLLCACEFVGMLRAIRWISDDRRAWDEAATG